MLEEYLFLPFFTVFSLEEVCCFNHIRDGYGTKLDHGIWVVLSVFAPVLASFIRDESETG
jgi:hypothetical protein